jgi:hypothetical protein
MSRSASLPEYDAEERARQVWVGNWLAARGKERPIESESKME